MTELSDRTFVQLCSIVTASAFAAVQGGTASNRLVHYGKATKRLKKTREGIDLGKIAVSLQ